MEIQKKSYRKHYLITLIIAVPVSFVIGLTLSNLLMVQPTCPLQAPLSEVQTNNSTFSRDASANPSALRSVTVSKAEYNAMTCINNNASATTAFKLYYGEDSRGAKYCYVMGMTNTTFNTGVIYKLPGVPPVSCPPICDVSDPVTTWNNQ